MGPDVAAFLLGVLVATVSFFIKGVVADAVQGVRFRKRLCADMKLIVAAHHGHYPELGALMRRMDSAGGSPAFLWDSSSESGMQETIWLNGRHLTAGEAAQANWFYDALSRIDEIRKEYNLAVRGMVLDPSKRTSYVALARACLSDLEDHYQELLRGGCECLLDVKHRHWFMDVDESHCKGILSRLHETSAKHLRAKGPGVESDPGT